MMLLMMVVMILMMTMVINISRVARNAPHPVGHVNLAGEHQRAAQQCHIFQQEDRNDDDSDVDDYDCDVYVNERSMNVHNIYHKQN